MKEPFFQLLYLYCNCTQLTQTMKLTFLVRFKLLHYRDSKQAILCSMVSPCGQSRNHSVNQVLGIRAKTKGPMLQLDVMIYTYIHLYKYCNLLVILRPTRETSINTE